VTRGRPSLPASLPAATCGPACPARPQGKTSTEPGPSRPPSFRRSGPDSCGARASRLPVPSGGQRLELELVEQVQDGGRLPGPVPLSSDGHRPKDVRLPQTEHRLARLGIRDVEERCGGRDVNDRSGRKQLDEALGRRGPTRPAGRLAPRRLEIRERRPEPGRKDRRVAQCMGEARGPPDDLPHRPANRVGVDPSREARAPESPLHLREQVPTSARDLRAGRGPRLRPAGWCGVLQGGNRLTLLDATRSLQPGLGGSRGHGRRRTALLRR